MNCDITFFLHAKLFRPYTVIGGIIKVMSMDSQSFVVVQIKRVVVAGQ